MCLCHIGNGDIGKLLPAPLNFTQLFAFPYACGYDVRLQVFSHCNSKSYMHAGSSVYFMINIR
jgi:hypothetical protein